MVDILTKNSRDAIYWLNDEINVDLSNVVLLGGHSHARTHKGDKLPPGFAIVSALTKKLDGFQAENPDQLTILKSSTLTKILTEGNKVKGIEFTDSEKQLQKCMQTMLCWPLVGSLLILTHPHHCCKSTDLTCLDFLCQMVHKQLVTDKNCRA